VCLYTRYNGTRPMALEQRPTHWGGGGGVDRGDLKVSRSFQVIQTQ
jgi:hypothetical protein